MAQSKVLIGTGNAHKLMEISQILDFPDIEFLSLNDLPEIEEPEENGYTFTENAIIKARYYHKQFGIPCLADDSGLEVDALNGAPGIYSSRFAGDDAKDIDNNHLLLQKLKNINDTSANYVCVAAYVNDNIVEVFEGKFYGYIGREFRGNNGFGYDSLFYFEHKGKLKAVAELEPEIKNGISHRAIAIRRFRTWFKSYLSENIA